MGKPLGDEMKALFLLASLPETPIWEVFTTSYLQSLPADQPPTFEAVSTCLLSQITCTKRNEKTTSDTTSALVSNAKATQEGQGPYCDYHERHGHSMKDCRDLKELKKDQKGKKRKRPKERDKPRSRAKANRADTDSEEGDSDSESDTIASKSETANRTRTKHRNHAERAFVTKSLMKRVQLYTLAASNNVSKRSEDILIDSGCSRHMTPHRSWFINSTYRKLRRPIPIHLGDDSTIKAVGVGSIERVQTLRGERQHLVINDVLYAPDLAVTLLSVRHLARRHCIVFDGPNCQIHDRKTSTVVAEGIERGNLYLLPSQPVSTIMQSHESMHVATDVNVLHRCLGHIDHDSIRRMVSKGHLTGIDTVTGTEEFCESCVQAKMKKLPFWHSREPVAAPLVLLHSDIGGPITPQSISGFRYWMTIIDDCTRYPWIMLLRHKDEALNKFKEWQAAVEPLLQKKAKSIEFSQNWVRIFRTDNGGEYISHKFEAHLRSCGIMHQTTAPDTPEQNGLAECMNQTITGRALAMLIDSKLPRTYWSYAYQMATYLIARSPASGIDGRTPYEELTGQKVDASHLRPFGCRAYSLVPKKQCSKLDSHARRCVLLGYEYASKAYTLLDITNRKIFKSRHVVFDESPGTTPELQREENKPIEWETTSPNLDHVPGKIPTTSPEEI